ncbi:DUF6252 family protein [Solitalea sp. MAHUQ-68]|uniref:DUF6252 family protein n=1 Tax=Solitalea agri TaxID=2953739 RepID=A0A9X2JC52_9SPHI|nr:DUF6252 family protein [Solitalea agri]MCO4292149.1 DUF6252 family protein [Solitalea agri]
MKKQFLYICLFLMSLLLISGSCKKEKIGIAALPEATQEGKNTFGCLLNGKAFLPKGSAFGSPVLNCYYQYINDSKGNGYYFHVSASKETDKECEVYSIAINSTLMSIEEGETYPLKSESIGNISGDFWYYPPSCVSNFTHYSTTSNSIGELKITHFDQTRQIVSGTFWFDAINDKGEKVEVREGRFDMKYTL